MFWFSPIFALLVLIPAVSLLRRGGYSPWSALLLLVPFVNVVFIWWLAFARGAERNGHGAECPRREHSTRDAETVEPVSPA
jgi:uncharacterized membrane protein YhaH (DUF805 family)